MRLGRVLDEGEVDALCGEKSPQLLPKGVHTQPADQRGRHAELGGRDRLVRALAAGKIPHRFPGDRLAYLRMPVGRRHHIHINATGDEDAPHAIPNSSGHAPTANSCLTASMSARLGSPASLPRRWIL